MHILTVHTCDVPLPLPLGHMSTDQAACIEVSQKSRPKIPDHPFRGHFVSGTGGLGMKLTSAHTENITLK